LNELRFRATVLAALSSAGLDRSRPLVAAVSGGVDSMALLEALRLLAPDEGIELIAAHFNHGLRGAGSDADERFVERWCAGHGIRCVSGRADTSRGSAHRGRSPEAAARAARYGFLARVQADAGAWAVATGHTMDDQAETVLLHLLRGSGLAGLRGMASITILPAGAGLSAVTVVRPLLGLRRSDTAAYCDVRGISPRQDPTNDDLSIPRNRLRHRVIPLLAEVSPAAISAIARLANAVREDVDLLGRETDAAWDRVVGKAGGGRVSVSRNRFLRLHAALQRRVLMRMHDAVAEVGRSDEDSLALDHVEAMLALAPGRAGTSLDLPRELRFAVGYRALTMSSGRTADDGCPFPFRVGAATLNVPGSFDVGDGFTLRTRRVRSTPGTRPSRWTAYLKPSTARGLALRARRPGDRFRPAGMDIDKKLQDFFVDERVPREWRDRVPLLVTNRGIAWVVGYRVADWALARAGQPSVRVAASRGGASEHR
jgi:tRNA(Ile)-lysidine synthase